MRISDWSSDVCSSDLSAGDLPECEESNQQQQCRDHICRHASEALDNRMCGYDRKRGGIAHPAAAVLARGWIGDDFRSSIRSEEHTSELQSLMRISYAVFCLKKTNI